LAHRNLRHWSGGCKLVRPTYFPELIDCLRDTLQQIERGDDGNSIEVQELKRRIVLLLADLELKEPAKTKCA
jgi:hypothetical protein